MDAGTRVCPFCGEPPGPGVFCAACGRNLSQVEQLPTRGTWERERDGGRESPGSIADVVAAFLAAMRAAGDPGAVKLRRAEPGFLGRAQHVHGWVVHPGRFITIDGRLHRLASSTQGVGYRGPVYVDVVGPEVVEPAEAGSLADDLAAVARANGLDGTGL